MIALAGSDDESPVNEWPLLGIDLGYFHSRWSHYSTILNEILFGTQPARRAYAERLNENLLFPPVGTMPGGAS